MGLKDKGGLGLLLEPSDDQVFLPSDRKPPNPLRVVVEDVLGLSPVARAEHSSTSNVWALVNSVLSDKTRNSEPGLGNEEAGRLGPSTVVPDRGSIAGQISQNGLVLESLTTFSSFRANSCVYGGGLGFASRGILGQGRAPIAGCTHASGSMTCTPCIPC